MQQVSSASVVNILRNTLNYVDTRLTDHGRRVSYLVYRMLLKQDKWSPAQLRDMCMLAMLHDIGAYKTEEISQMIRFETEEVWDHSIWGYLFLLHFSPLADLSPAILYHHADYDSIPLEEVEPLCVDLAQIINITDRADTYEFLEEEHSRKELFVFFDSLRDTRYRSDIVDLFQSVHTQELEPGDIDADMGYFHVMHETPFDQAAIDAYLQMDILSIDFRSQNTATHTITTSACSRELARLMGLDSTVMQQISTGALLHDLGKTGIPVEILEFPGRLSAQAMRIMKRHVIMTESILSGNVDESTLHIAVRHHEKLDGTGYPRGLQADDLTTGDRIVAVSDIFSALYEQRSYKRHYPKERILGILNQMAEDGLVDKTVVQAVNTHFDELAEKIESVRDPIAKKYAVLQSAFDDYKLRFDPKNAKSTRKPRHPHDDQYSHL